MNGSFFLSAESVLFYSSMALYAAAMFSFFVLFAVKNEKAGNIGNVLAIAALVFHTLALITRGIGAHRLPMTNQYEFASCFAWGISLCFCIFSRKYNFKALGAFIMPVVFVIIGYAAMQSREVKELMPALQSRWLSVHVCSAIIGYGSFGVSAAVSAMFLLHGKLGGSIGAHSMPSPEKMDSISYRAVSLGFLFLTFVLITGAIWAEQAWGSYWSWDPKETWALITWFIYSIYLHLRIRKGWKGRSAAWFSVIGFICVIFTYIGVNTLLPGIHSYA